MNGKTILAVEITNISTHGLWLFANEKEYFFAQARLPPGANQTASYTHVSLLKLMLSHP